MRAGDIPETLWRLDDSCLQLAPDLVRAWEHLLDLGGLRPEAMKPVSEDVIGGKDVDATNQHLASKFTGSSARVQLAILDPNEKVSDVADAFAQIFSGGNVLLADVPSGSGAAALTILSTIAELRRQHRMPRVPLNIKLVGGELSPLAREYSSKAMETIMSSLNEQAIWVEFEFVAWDVLCKFSTRGLIRRITILGDKCSARALVLANFSGFLQGGTNWKKASPQIESLFLHSQEANSLAIWLEPKTNKVLDAGNGFFSRLRSWFADRLSELLVVGDESFPVVRNLGIDDAQAQHPLRSEQKFRVNLAVQRFDLPFKKDEL